MQVPLCFFLCGLTMHDSARLPPFNLLPDNVSVGQDKSILQRIHRFNSEQQAWTIWMPSRILCQFAMSSLNRTKLLQYTRAAAFSEGSRWTTQHTLYPSKNSGACSPRETELSRSAQRNRDAHKLDGPSPCVRAFNCSLPYE